MDLNATSTIQLCLIDEVMYNAMDEETTTRLWSSLGTLYMMKSLSNKLFLKKQLYGLHMKEWTVVLEHLNFFNKVISELLTVDVKNRPYQLSTADAPVDRPEKAVDSQKLESYSISFSGTIKFLFSDGF